MSKTNKAAGRITLSGKDFDGYSGNFDIVRRIPQPWWRDGRVTKLEEFADRISTAAWAGEPKVVDEIVDELLALVKRRERALENALSDPLCDSWTVASIREAIGRGS